MHHAIIMAPISIFDVALTESLYQFFCGQKSYPGHGHGDRMEGYSSIDIITPSIASHYSVMYEYSYVVRKFYPYQILKIDLQ